MDVPGFAFITGGGSGIGRASAEAFAREGSSGVVVTDINLETAQATVEVIKAVATHPTFKAEAIQLDVTSEEAVKAAIAHTSNLFGRIDYVVNSAGIAADTFGPVSETNFADFKKVQEVNVNGAFLVTSAASAAMKAQETRLVDAARPARGTTRGSIVLLASVTAVISVPGMVQYTTSKHAILGITKTAAIDMVSDGIRVNCLCPAWTKTPMIQVAMDVVPGLEQNMLSGVPMNRLATAEEVADSVLYLSGSRSSFTTGTSLIMDGGMSLGRKA
ncbi:unnamed protein product [Clonostachys rosea]|uniref:Uncharacterized protein n=1 Tax=Bionectria ochroleuca TaxID=29856 RepID=A0ABY6U7P8_BIOOC|nr:unnamed protein product [Clonostachys rosea]